MEFKVQNSDGVSVVTIDADRIDAAVAINFKDKMRELTTGFSGRMVLNLSNVNFIDSSGLGAIVAAMKLMPATGKLELAGLTPTVDKVFRMTRMDSIFTIHDTAANA